MFIYPTSSALLACATSKNKHFCHKTDEKTIFGKKYLCTDFFLNYGE